MIRDADNMFLRPLSMESTSDSPKTINSATTTSLQNFINMGAARPIGTGGQLIPYVVITGTSGTSTVQIQLCGADDTSKTNPVVLSSTGALSITNGVTQTLYGAPATPAKTKKQYLYMQLVSAGSSPVFDVLEAGLTDAPWTNAPTYMA